jgi:hypothetical protein
MDEARLAEVEYMKQLNKFSRTIDAKSDHKRNVIINRIRESLRSEYEMLHHVESSPCIQIAKESKACSKCADIMISYYGLKET